MPLIKSKSKKAFAENVSKEMESGKPQKQALAIAYATKKAGKKKMAYGGEAMESEGSESITESIMKKRKMADGGDEVSDLDQTPLVDQDDHYDQQNIKAAEKPMYDDSQLSEDPWDSNMHGDSEMLSDALNMVEKIRHKMRLGSNRK